MKKVITALLIQSLISLQIFAQAPQTLISGNVADNKKKPVESATISLLKAADSSLVKITVTDKAGKFSFQNIPFGNYYVNASAISYAKLNSKVFELNEVSLTKDVDAMVLQQEAKSLGAVTVTAKKPLIEQKIDRMVVNVDASITNVGATALEVLEKSPGVLIDKDGNISLKGKAQVLVMIDGKPSYLTGGDLANLLSNMNANQLSQIEIMTSPSAKYDAAGNAGIINIRTKKSVTQGFNGSVTLSYGQGVYAKSNNNLSLNYRTGKTNTFLNYGYSLNNNFLNFDINRNFIGAGGLKTSELDQQSSRINHGLNNNLKVGFDYFISPNTTIGFGGSGFLAPQKQDAFTTSYLKDGSGNITSIENTVKTASNTWNNGALNFNFHTANNKHGELTVNADYLHYDFTGSQNLTGTSFAPDKTFLAESYLRNALPLTLDIYSGRVDYAQPLAGGINLETGVKWSRVDTKSTSDFSNLLNNIWQFDSILSSSFRYRENVSAAYINASKDLGKWMIQAGLRLENTGYDGLQSGAAKNSDSSFSRSYLNLFPSAFVSYKANEKNRFSLSVSRRIDRPAYQSLNPFLSFIDKYTYSTGNPFLQPQFSNNIELSHTYKGWLTTTLNYGVVHQMINETLAHADSIIIRSEGNIGTRYNMGIAVSANFPVTRWWTSTLFTNLYQNIYRGSINGYPLNASAVTLNLNINNQFALGRNWAAELSGAYISRNRDEGQAIILPSGQVSAGLSKQLFNNKASLKLNVRDIFYTQNPKEIQNFQDVQSTMQMSRDTRVVNLAFVYRFGTAGKSKSAKGAPLEEQERVRTF